MKSAAASIAPMVLAASSFAQPGSETRIDIKARVKGTGAWLDVLNVTAEASSPVEVELGIFLYRSSGWSIGGSVCTVIASGWGDSDAYQIVDHPEGAQHPDGRLPYFNFGGQIQSGYTTGIDAGHLRIAAKNNTQDNIAGGISMKTHSQSYDTSDGLLAFRFDFVIANPTPGISNSHSIVADVPLDHVNSFYVWNEMPPHTSTSSLMAVLRPTDVASININWATCFTVSGSDDAMVCPLAPAAFVVSATGPGPFTYQWQFKGGLFTEWTSLANGPNLSGDQLVLNASGARTRVLIVDHDASPWPSGVAGQVRCVVTSDCGNLPSFPAKLTICGADFNCDGFVTGEDFDAFHEAFAEGLPETDFNGDGFVNGDDFDQFVVAFETGC